MKRAILVLCMTTVFISCGGTQTNDAPLGLDAQPADSSASPSVSKPPSALSADPSAKPAASTKPAVKPTAKPKPKPAVKPPVALAVKVTSRTSSVPRNGDASVTIKTSKGARCYIDVQYASGSSTAKGLGSKTANSAGAITWTWRVGGNTTKGTWPIYISCALGSRSADTSTSFTVS